MSTFKAKIDPKSDGCLSYCWWFRIRLTTRNGAKNLVKNGRNYQPQLVFTPDFSHQQSKTCTWWSWGFSSKILVKKMVEIPGKPNFRFQTKKKRQFFFKDQNLFRIHVPGDLLRDQTLSPIVGGHDFNHLKGSREITIPNRSQRIAR